MARAQHEYDDIPGTFVFDAERSRQGYGINMFCMSLMKDENRKAFKANEAEYLKKFNADAGADRRDPQARLQPHAGARRQHLFHRQARRDRRAFVPPPRRDDDRLDPGRLRRDDARRRPLGRRQPQQVRQGAVGSVLGEQGKPKAAKAKSAKAKPKSKSANRSPKRSAQQVEVEPWLGSSQEWRRRTCRPSARRSTTSRPRSRTGSGCSRASRNPRSGWRTPSRTSPSWSTTTTPRRSRSSWCRPSRSAARRNSRPPTRAGARGRCRW